MEGGRPVIIPSAEGAGVASGKAFPSFVAFTKDGEVPTLASIKGTKIGVKGALTPSVKAMLAMEGLVEGTDYETVLLDGFDPTVHIEVPDIIGFPGYKSNEPNQLKAAGVKFKLYDPADHDIPGSFGIIYTNQQFLADHPTAATDFMRAPKLAS